MTSPQTVEAPEQGRDTSWARRWAEFLEPHYVERYWVTDEEYGILMGNSEGWPYDEDDVQEENWDRGECWWVYRVINGEGFSSSDPADMSYLHSISSSYPQCVVAGVPEQEAIDAVARELVNARREDWEL